ncbi:FERM and PDZ domain-containing protein 1-like [Megalops cyprinoides]|uniref:FERM and PDZ domain-containing protein 1-like n=1 Tax=Megalops cyprinoides TaxID=118141 RepID=UPI001863C78D|nr:FERM and PDZ domain-containing protein 1-like [Megalops cyprinoides]
MEERERSRSPSRRASRVEQVVGRWLRRSRDSISRERKSSDSKSGGASGSGHQNAPVRVTVQIQRDPLLGSHGFTVADQLPLLVRDVTAGGPADGKLFPGDQVLKINNIVTEDLSSEQAAEIIRELEDSVNVTVLRHSMGPKSSFMTAEKRARLRTNPVKVRFAEEVVVNGHAQGNSMLFLPNVLKVYLENGQTKAFRFEATTTVKDIVLTLKEKLSIRCIRHFALVLDQQYSNSRLLLLHEEELIQQVVQRKDSHDYRCVFRVSFLPRDPMDLLQEDPVAFEYLYLQSVSDVLRERFAVEMKCNTALCLAALHMQERLHSCGQTHRASVKSITKDWGIDNFISPTLLRNMREKDLRKAISYHMKKTQSLLEPKQKMISAAQARLNYLTQLGELQSYGGKFFTATMMFQDRESMVNLLVGAKYGISQVINHKLNLVATLIEFNSISRVELMPESDKVSLVKIYLPDAKPMVLLMESVAAKDLSCLVTGYCRLLEPEQPSSSSADQPKAQRVSAEEGYVSPRCSDSDVPVEVDPSANVVADLPFPGNDTGAALLIAEEKPKEEEEEEENAEVGRAEDTPAAVTGMDEMDEVRITEDLLLELSDWCYTDSRIDASFSSDSMEALVEDGLVPRALGGLANHPEEPRSHLLNVPAQQEMKELAAAPEVVFLEDVTPETAAPETFAPETFAPETVAPEAVAPEVVPLEDVAMETVAPETVALEAVAPETVALEDVAPETVAPEAVALEVVALESTAPHATKIDNEENAFLCFADLSRMADCLPSPPEASEEEEEQFGSGLPPLTDRPFTFGRNSPQHCYNVCSEATPNSACCLPKPQPHCTQEEEEEEEKEEEEEEEQDPPNNSNPAPTLQDPPGFGDSSSEDEFFDASDRFTSPVPVEETTSEDYRDADSTTGTWDLEDGESGEREEERGREGREERRETEPGSSCFGKRCRKRRSFMEAGFTSQASSTELDEPMGEEGQPCPEGGEASDQRPRSTVTSPNNPEGEPAPVESNPILNCDPCLVGPHPGDNVVSSEAKQLPSSVMEMELDTAEYTLVTGLLPGASLSILTACTKVETENRQNLGSEGEENGEGSCATYPVDPPDFPRSDPDQGDSAIRDTEKDKPGALLNEEHDPGPQLGCPGQQILPRSHSLEDAVGGLSLAKTVPPPLPESLPPHSSVPIIPSPEEAEINANEVYLEGTSPILTLNSPRNNNCLALLMNNGVSLSCENLLPSEKEASGTSSVAAMVGVGGPTKEPRVFDLQSCAAGLVGRLSTSTLRGKIQRLPWYLSRTIEPLVNHNSNYSAPSSETSQGTTEVTAAVEDNVKFVEEVLMEVSQVPKETVAHPKVATEVVTSPQNGGQGPAPQTGERKESHQPTDCHTAARTGEAWLANWRCGALERCASEQPHPWPRGSASFGCGPTSALGCPSELEETRGHREPCGCQTVYANCFSGQLDGGGFDEDLTAHGFPRRTQGSEGAPLKATPPPLSSPSSSPSFTTDILPPSSAPELSPQPSPLKSPNGFPPKSLEDTLDQLCGRRYRSPDGFALLQRDVGELLGLLHATHGPGTPHRRGACETVLSDSGLILHAEGRRLILGCQQATRECQAPEEMLQCLSEGFHALVRLAGACLRSSRCGGCEQRRAKALGGLREVAGAYGEFAWAAERAAVMDGSREVSVKRLSRQCAALIAAMVSLTQLFCTISIV